MIYDPKNPLSEAELEVMGKEDFDKFLDYLDAKAAYLKSISGRPDKKQTEIVKMMQEQKYLSK
jgi:hypothetical protein